MVRIVLVTLVLLVFASTSLISATEVPSLTPQQAGLREERLTEMDALISGAIELKQMPGCVVLVGRPNGIVWFKAYGNKRIEPEREVMTEDTVFDLASLTKPLATATSILKLVQML